MDETFPTINLLRETNSPSSCTCSKCSSRSRCLPSSLNERHVSQLDRMIGKRRSVERNSMLFRIGDPFRSLHIIHCGQFMTFQESARGKQNVLGFHMTGEILGLGAISTGFQDNNALALEDSNVCEIPFRYLEEICAEVPPLQQHFHRILSKEITRQQGIKRMLGARAEQRLAIFLLDLSLRYAGRGFSGMQFQLLMSRELIGSYVGLTMESISRLMSEFRKKGWITIDGKDIHICNYGAIKALANDNDLEVSTNETPPASNITHIHSAQSRRTIVRG
ncbi:helix-turn-helix domain-containing protein [Janthinobacterium rivuli]|uniref:helix-turn-helix domain-containing protein n=1 Tax=Janthinobacterium sp. FT68W TaxID=2654255 RepID=UPI0012645F00|nr:helix-turn-helix domain-containing protein [Janthinobacterium sp. FT68W]